MTKIIDCFIFYNELELLTYRLNILNDVVDFFVIVEGTHTFLANEKKLFFNDNKNLFEKFNHKIIHIILDDFPYKSNHLINDYNKCDNEKYQRLSIEKGINSINNLSDDDIIIIADLDEIPNPEILKKIKNNEITINLNTLEMDFYYYNLHTKFKNNWMSVRILTYKIFKELNMDCNYIRYLHHHYNNIPTILNGGWHLSYFGDKYFIKNKLQNFSHIEYNTPKYTNVDYIQDKINRGVDLFERKTDEINFIKIEDNNNLPPQYEKYLTKYIIN